ncbi:MAG: GMC oxidoreductase, partial [Gemmatimonas sp.]
TGADLGRKVVGESEKRISALFTQARAIAPCIILLDGLDSVAPNRMALFSAHVNGTCRMGTDPATSGATPDGERHGVRGLYITDGAALPTALGVNPQETIMAVSTVLAGRIVARHAGLLR